MICVGYKIPGGGGESAHFVKLVVWRVVAKGRRKQGKNRKGGKGGKAGSKGRE